MTRTMQVTLPEISGSRARLIERFIAISRAMVEVLSGQVGVVAKNLLRLWLDEPPISISCKC